MLRRRTANNCTKVDKEDVALPAGRDAPALCRASVESNRIARLTQHRKTLRRHTKLRPGTVSKSLARAVLVLKGGETVSDIFPI